MPTICFHVRVDAVENCEVHCSDVHLAIDRADLGTCTHAAVILGLPTAITKRELEIFVDPFAEGIVGLCLLKERKCFETGHALVQVTQYKTMALLFFVDEIQLLSFKDLYNNMQLPSYSETAPCVVVQLSSLVVHCSNPNLHQSIAAISKSTSCSPNGKVNMINASPGRPFSTKVSTPQQRHGDSLLSRGTELLMQHCAPPLSDSPTSGCKASPAEQAEVVPQMVALPTCTVCLRRIRCVSTLAHGLSGANDLMVGRSYTCDAKLTFGELSTIDLKEDADVTVSGVKSAAETAEDSSGSGVRCIVCHIYHEVTVSRSIGTTNSSSNNASSSLLDRLHSLRMNPSTAVAATGTLLAPDSDISVTAPVSATSGPYVTSTASSSSATVTGVGRCRKCHLSENIWLCLQCGHTGCGRYTSQHAKAHYHDTLLCNGRSTTGDAFSASHNLSLELASGRIWNYETDTFDYIEDESSHYFPSAGSARSMAHSAFQEPLAIDATATQTDELPLDRASPTQCKKFLLPSFLYTGAAEAGNIHPSRRLHGRGGPSEDLLNPASAAALGLDEVTTDKINALMNNYERLLEAQLLDQQLYFEKLLARETVRALELSYMPLPVPEKSEKSEKNTSTTGANKKNKAIVKKSSVVEVPTSAATESKSDDFSPISTTEDAANTGSYSTNPSLLTESQTYRDASSAVQNPEVVEYMHEVEQLKVEISTIEMQYREVLDRVKRADEASRGLKKKNDALLRGQQALKDKEVKLKARSVEVQKEHSEQVRDLQQQIQDLTFYAKARKQVQESPLKDELKQGTVVTTQRLPLTPVNNSSSGSGGTGSGSTSNGGERKVSKRK